MRRAHEERSFRLIYSRVDPRGKLRIVEALAHGPELCVGDLSAVVGATESAVSHQLRQLRQLRMVRSRREGRMAYYRLDDEHVADLFRLGLDHVRE